MKKSNLNKIIKIFVIVAVCFQIISTGCDKKNNDDNNIVYGDVFQFSSDESFDNLDYFFYFISISGEIYLWIFAAKKVGYSKLILNGVEKSLYWHFQEIDSTSHADFYELDFEPGDEVSYELTIDDKIFTDIIIIPYPTTLNVPSEFDPGLDFTFSWTISQSPRTFLCYFYINNNQEARDVGWDIKNSDRHFTIPKSNYLSDWTSVEIELYAFNYWFDSQNKFLSCASSLNHAEYSNGKPVD